MRVAARVRPLLARDTAQTPGSHSVDLTRGESAKAHCVIISDGPYGIRSIGFTYI